MEPTKEQIKDFWECCGWQFCKANTIFDGEGNITSWPDYWESPEAMSQPSCPNIDLNNLFKYAVPKACNYSQDDNMLIIKGQGKDTDPDPDDDGEWWEVTIEGCGVPSRYQSEGKDPALALFWAISELIKESKPNDR